MEKSTADVRFSERETVETPYQRICVKNTP